jgi:Tfp pilus assembly protein PilX
MRDLLQRLRARMADRDDAGVAMVMTVTIMLLLTLVPLIVFDQAVQQLPIARHEQDHESALHAAEAGVDDYLNHLNNNANYWLYSTAATSPDNNQALDTYVAVPGAATNETFRYTVDSSLAKSQGIVTLTSSGKASGVVRTVKVGLRRLGFLDYLYMTDYELVDPGLSGEPTSSCQWHAWEKNPSTGGYGPANGCSVIYWTNQAVLNGPTHTNDGLYLCGNPQFNGNVDTFYNQPTSQSVAGSTSFGGSGTWLNPMGCSNTPTFKRSGDPVSGQKLDMPPANTAIAQQANGTAGPGCLYTGPTTISLYYTGSGSSAVGKMDVVSPGTAANKTAAGCAPGTGLSLPSNGVIYVQGVPQCSGSSCNGDVKLSNGSGSGKTGGLAGQLTIAAANDIVITGNVTYRDNKGTDVLGLIANNNVSVYHPVGAGDLTSPTIEAAILSLNHSFYVQNWNQGSPLGTLNVNGVIAQKFRGAVGTFDQSGNISTGYNKNYVYDTRLKYLTPPYFLNPLQSSWAKLNFAEVVPIP